MSSIYSTSSENEEIKIIELESTVEERSLINEERICLETEENKHLINYIKDNMDWNQLSFSITIFQKYKQEFSSNRSVEEIQNKFYKEILPNLSKYNILNIREILLFYDRADFEPPFDLFENESVKCYKIENEPDGLKSDYAEVENQIHLTNDETICLESEENKNLINYIKKNMDWSQLKFSIAIFEKYKQETSSNQSAREIQNNFVKEILPNLPKYGILNVDELLLFYNRAGVEPPFDLAQQKCLNHCNMETDIDCRQSKYTDFGVQIICDAISLDNCYTALGKKIRFLPARQCTESILAEKIIDGENIHIIPDNMYEKIQKSHQIIKNHEEKMNKFIEKLIFKENSLNIESHPNEQSDINIYDDFQHSSPILSHFQPIMNELKNKKINMTTSMNNKSKSYCEKIFSNSSSSLLDETPESLVISDIEENTMEKVYFTRFKRENPKVYVPAKVKNLPNNSFDEVRLKRSKSKVENHPTDFLADAFEENITEDLNFSLFDLTEISLNEEDNICLSKSLYIINIPDDSKQSSPESNYQSKINGDSSELKITINSTEENTMKKEKFARFRKVYLPAKTKKLVVNSANEYKSKKRKISEVDNQSIDLLCDPCPQNVSVDLNFSIFEEEENLSDVATRINQFYKNNLNNFVFQMVTELIDVAKRNNIDLWLKKF